MTYRRGRKPQRDPRDPVTLAKKLPIKFRSFDAWQNNRGGGPAPGLVAYRRALREQLVELIGAELVDDELVSAVQSRAAGSAGVWWRQALRAEIGRVR